jgi:two-component system cell cycle response regulator
MAALTSLPTTGRVLIVDDSLIALEVISSRLKEHGLEVTSSASPRQALALAAEGAQQFDLFILDVMMPEMNGHELTRRLRALPHATNTPILLLTSLDSPEDRLARTTSSTRTRPRRRCWRACAPSSRWGRCARSCSRSTRR